MGMCASKPKGVDYDKGMESKATKPVSVSVSLAEDFTSAKQSVSRQSLSSLFLQEEEEKREIFGQEIGPEGDVRQQMRGSGPKTKEASENRTSVTHEIESQKDGYDVKQSAEQKLGENKKENGVANGEIVDVEMKENGIPKGEIAEAKKKENGMSNDEIVVPCDGNPNSNVSDTHNAMIQSKEISEAQEVMDASIQKTEPAQNSYTQDTEPGNKSVDIFQDKALLHYMPAVDVTDSKKDVVGNPFNAQQSSTHDMAEKMPISDTDEMSGKAESLEDKYVSNSKPSTDDSKGHVSIRVDICSNDTENQTKNGLVDVEDKKCYEDADSSALMPFSFSAHNSKETAEGVTILLPSEIPPKQESLVSCEITNDNKSNVSSEASIVDDNTHQVGDIKDVMQVNFVEKSCITTPSETLSNNGQQLEAEICSTTSKEIGEENVSATDESPELTTAKGEASGENKVPEISCFGDQEDFITVKKNSVEEGRITTPLESLLNHGHHLETETCSTTCKEIGENDVLATDLIQETTIAKGEASVDNKISEVSCCRDQEDVNSVVKNSVDEGCITAASETLRDNGQKLETEICSTTCKEIEEKDLPVTDEIQETTKPDGEASVDNKISEVSCFRDHEDAIGAVRHSNEFENGVKDKELTTVEEITESKKTGFSHVDEGLIENGKDHIKEEVTKNTEAMTTGSVQDENGIKKDMNQVVPENVVIEPVTTTTTNNEKAYYYAENGIKEDTEAAVVEPYEKACYNAENGEIDNRRESLPRSQENDFVISKTANQEKGSGELISFHVESGQRSDNGAIFSNEITEDKEIPTIETQEAAKLVGKNSELSNVESKDVAVLNGTLEDKNRA